MTVQELENLKPPFFVKGYRPGSPNRMHLTFNELGVDEEGNWYVDAELEMTARLVMSSKYDKEATKKNPFYYYGRPREPWPSSQQWHELTTSKYSDRIEVYKEDKYFQQAIMNIFGDK